MQPMELLSPAGSFRKLQYAYEFGADAAYVGIPLFSLRARENEFSLEELKKAKALAVAKNKKLYLTINIFSRNRKINAFSRQLEDLVSIKPDALIMSDPGLMTMVREKYPQIPIHLSVQANCMNWQSVKFWNQSLNIERVILSRELSLDEIKEIKQRVPDVELEAFVHGAICIAYSGRCLLSSYFSYRDANQGVCDNSCREKYNIYLEDQRNEGQLYPIEESEEGTLIMNAKDLCMVEHLAEIAKAGVCSLKIEGRSKSEYYVSMVTRIYRQALNDLYQGQEFNKNHLLELQKISNRGYHTGFMMGTQGQESQNYEFSVNKNLPQKFAGLYLGQAEPAEALLSQNQFYPFEVRNKVTLGQTVEVIQPNQQSFTSPVREILNSKGEKVDTAHGGAGQYFIKIDQTPEPHSLLSVLN